MDAYSLPDRVTVRLAKDDRDRMAALAKTMLQHGRIFVNATDVLREALKAAAAEMGSQKNREVSP